MSESDNHADSKPESGQSSLPASAGTGTRPKSGKPQPRLLPPWKVLLHNDQVNELVYVVQTVQMLTPLSREDSINRTIEAHKSGVSLLLTTHQERAELYLQQFASKNLTVTIEPAEV